MMPPPCGLRCCLIAPLFLFTLASHSTAAIEAATASGQSAPMGQRLQRRGDEIVVCGQFFHTGAPVVLWMDPGGYDAYRVEPRFAAASQPATASRPAASDGGAHYGIRGDR